MADGTGDIETSADLLQAEIQARAVLAQERADDIERTKTTLAREGLTLTGDALLVLMGRKARWSTLASRLRMLDHRMDRGDEEIGRSHPEWVSLTLSPGFRALDGAVAAYLEEQDRTAIEDAELGAAIESWGTP